MKHTPRWALALAPLLVFACSDFATAPDRTPTELRVAPDTVLLTAGGTVSFELQLLDQDGQLYDHIPTWAPLWSSDDPEVVAVDASGVGTALRAGESQAMVLLGGLQGTAVVRANPVELGLEVPVSYVTQSVQRPAGDIPLIAGRDGFLRAFVVGDDINWFRPKVRATFYHGAEPVHSMLMTMDGQGVPREVDEGELALSYDADVPGWVLQPGVGLVLEIDPEGVVPARSGSVTRVPAEGMLTLDIQEARPFRWMLVPVDLATNELNSRMSPAFAEPMSRMAEDVYPFGEFHVEARAPYTTDLDLATEQGWYQLIEDMTVLRWDDGNPHYYYGAINRPRGTSIGGLGYVGYPVSIGMDNQPDVIAHELGHNLGLPHAPCGNPSGTDPEFPYADGSIGQYGWDRRNRRLQRPSEKKDLMTYCDPVWISDYNYEKVIAYRDTSVFDAAFIRDDGAALRTPPTLRPVLVLQGGVWNGELRLRPALEWVGAARMPAGGGDYRLEGLDARGRILFSLAVQPRPLDHGGSQFMVAVPAETAQPDLLARIRLSGPEGVVERRAAGSLRRPAEVMVEPRGPGAPRGPALRFDAAAYPLAVIRDRDTGRIRAMSRTGSLELPEADVDRLEIVLSDGVRTRPARVVKR